MLIVEFFSCFVCCVVFVLGEVGGGCARAGLLGEEIPPLHKMYKQLCAVYLLNALDHK